MKVRYKITAAFILLTITVLAALCVLIYLINADQQKRDFNQRLRNRAVTVATLLSRLPVNGYEMLSKLDSSTTNLLVSENIFVFDDSNHVRYHFDKDLSEQVRIDADLLKEARERGSARITQGEKRIFAIYFREAKTPMVIVTAARDEKGDTNLRDLRRSLIIAFSIGIALALITGLWFSRRLLRPVEQIANTVNSISAGNIEARLQESPVKDEWNMLAVTFNKLLARLQESFEIQGRFISNASHELSTPLTVVSNQIEVTLQKPRSNAEYLEVLQSVHADVQHMSELTQQLLTLARTARGGALQTRPIRIDEIIMELPAMLKKISPEYLALVYFDELPDDERLSTVEGNYELLLSAFRNIAENGCKYAVDHTVQMSLSFVRDKIVVLFSNSYASFDPRELDAIFQPFQRGTHASGQPGYGLGLSLTRRIILLHKGEIRAEIPSPGKMLITVILPSSFQPHF